MGKRIIVATAVAAAAVPLLAIGGTAVAHADAGPGFSTSIEAEDGIRSIDLRDVPCGWCSGGARVTNLGGRDNGSLTFYLWIPAEDDYTVTVYYASDRPRDLTVNDKRLRRLDSGGWDKIAKKSVKVHLKERFHRPAVIDLGYDTHSPAADVDRIVVSR
jgi:hypothetical protein